MKRTFETVLDELTKEGTLYKTLPDDKLKCVACMHRCTIYPDKRGICQIRFNRDGKLWVPYGYVAGLQNDPIEKKPLYHFLPGTYAMTFGMLGCNFHCSYCQNWLSSQTLKDIRAGHNPYPVSADDIIESAKRYGSKSVVSSYNEPSITAEWALDIFKLAKQEGMKTGYVSNGYATREALEYLGEYLDAYKVDLKTFKDSNYRKLGGTLKNVLESIRIAHKMGKWIEIVTLLVPDFNDSSEELRDMAEFIAEVSVNIPWHISAFHPDYKMTDRGSTPLKTLLRAAKIGEKAGLKYIYIGNVLFPGRYNNTICHNCGEIIVKRDGFSVSENKINQGRCPECKEKIPGIWE